MYESKEGPAYLARCYKRHANVKQSSKATYSYFLLALLRDYEYATRPF